ncbi:DNA polymerase kappa [Nymphaea thermarum]|nr:DNA polymerase kappa [Nymphaea thermarum]
MVAGEGHRKAHPAKSGETSIEAVLTASFNLWNASSPSCPHVNFPFFRIAVSGAAMVPKPLTADVAETLSSDMQEDGLCGRTLTLKLKTASFEVRTRAVSLQRYIFSKDDILAHAYKLLKAELPVSLRLIGLRMSHLNEVKLAAADPMQKTLCSYMISDGKSAKDAPSSTCGDVREDFHKDDPGVAFPVESEDSFLSDTYINEMECLSDLADQSDLDISSKNLILCDASESLQNLQSGHSMEQLKKVHRVRLVDLEFVARGVLKGFVSAPQKHDRPAFANQTVSTDSPEQPKPQHTASSSELRVDDIISQLRNLIGAPDPTTSTVTTAASASSSGMYSAYPVCPATDTTD